MNDDAAAWLENVLRLGVLAVGRCHFSGLSLSRGERFAIFAFWQIIMRAYDQVWNEISIVNYIFYQQLKPRFMLKFRLNLIILHLLVKVRFRIRSKSQLINKS